MSNWVARRGRKSKISSKVAIDQALAPHPLPPVVTRRRRWISRWLGAAWRRIGWAIFAVGLAVSIVATTLRIYGVKEGILYGARPIQNVTTAIVGGCVLLVTGLLATRKDLGRANGSLTATFTTVGVLVSSVSLLGVWLPVVPSASDDPACPNARLRGDDVTVTGAVVQGIGGVNGRAQPSRASTQLSRFPGGCVIGFEGFCYGDPVTDAAYAGRDEERLDVRWLRVSRNPEGWRRKLAQLLSKESDREQYVAGAVIQTRSLENLRDQQIDPKQCPGKIEPPGPVKFSRPSEVPNGVLLQAEGDRGVDIQFAVFVDEVTDGRPYRQIERSKQANSQMLPVWRTGLTASVMKDESSPVLLVAAPCIAPGIPPLNLDTVAVRYGVLSKKNGTFTETRVTTLSDISIRNRAAETACQAVE